MVVLLAACSGTGGTTPVPVPDPGCLNGLKDTNEVGVDCGGRCAARCPGDFCTTWNQCISGICERGVCAEKTAPPCDGGSCAVAQPGPTDGKKNNAETDTDCGGPNAPACANGKACLTATDCVGQLCPETTKICSAPPTQGDGVQNGSETDVDCGGTGAGMTKCAEGLHCLVDTDCNAACDYKKRCVDVPSCKGQFGSDTCGGGDLDAGQAATHLTSTGSAPGHESCCRSLRVNGYVDSNQPTKEVYLDKYEITAGRMRAFLEALGGGVDAAGNAKPANVKAYMAAHRPARWNIDWENTLPTDNVGTFASYTVTTPTTNPLYPGADVYATFTPTLAGWTMTSGTYNVDFGVFASLGGKHLFPESTPDLAASHALNCLNDTGSYGLSTYWFDKATVISSSGGTTGKYFSKDQLDEKALTCVPFGLLAAFCAWDGGQLATAEVIDAITANTVSPVYSSATLNQGGKLFVGLSNTCGGTSDSSTWKYITYGDASSPCTPYFYPSDNGNTWDGTSRIAAPGRMPLDAIVKDAGDEPWMDLIGNLQEAVLKAGETRRFDYRGYGGGYLSSRYHKAQQTTARAKGGSMGGRCMRFK